MPKKSQLLFFEEPPGGDPQRKCVKILLLFIATKCIILLVKFLTHLIAEMKRS
jgi:hypothetical protein